MIGQKRCWSMLCMSVLALTWFWTGIAYSQSSTNYTIFRDVLDGGGGTAGSTNYRLTSSIGQASDSGNSSSDHYTNDAGFVDEGGGSGTASQYVLTFVKQGTGSGTVTLDGEEIESGSTEVYAVGAELTLHAAPDADSVFNGWSGGCTGTGDCVVTVDSDKVVTVTFTLKSYTIAASASTGGLIEPAGNVAVEHGADKIFTITPDEGYDLVDVLVDALSQGAISDYTFPNVSVDHTIEAIFAIKTFTIIASAGTGGSIEPEGTLIVNYGANHTFTISPDAGYEIETVLIDGAVVEELDTYTETEGETIITKATVTLTHVTANHSIEARFSEIVSGGSFLYDDWRDTDKSLSNPDDDWMCWAAAAANILDWAGWSTPLFDSAQDMFYAFQEYWTNAGGLMQYGWQWWFDGTEPPDLTGWAQLNEGWSQAEEGGSYWSEYNFFDYFSEDWALWDSDSGLWSDGSYLMAKIDEYLHDEYGVTLAIYSDSGGHALTAWGYEYDEWGNYTGIYVTDSDDYMSDLKLLPVTLVDDLWYLDTANDYGYSGWFIGGVQALDRRDPIPEPGTLILIVLGLLGLRVLVRKRIKHKK